jgi:hypothetical protein
MDDGPEIARVVIDLALAGDLQACGIVLARIAPALKAQAERVTINLDPSAPVTQQIETVLAAVSDGHIAPDVGQTLISSISALANARAVDELEARIITLEAKELS